MLYLLEMCAINPSPSRKRRWDYAIALAPPKSTLGDYQSEYWANPMLLWGKTALVAILQSRASTPFVLVFILLTIQWQTLPNVSNPGA